MSLLDKYFNESFAEQHVDPFKSRKDSISDNEKRSVSSINDLTRRINSLGAEIMNDQKHLEYMKNKFDRMFGSNRGIQIGPNQWKAEDDISSFEEKLDKKKDKIKQMMKDLKSFKESAIIDTKLNIYESYEAGLITESEKVSLLSIINDSDIYTEGNISKEFRYVINAKDGHLCKIVYDFIKDNITSNNLRTDNLDEFRKEVQSSGHSNYTSKGNKIVAIVDCCNNKRLDQIDGMPVIHNSGGSLAPMKINRVLSIYKQFGMSEDELKKKEEKLKKECPTGVCPNPGFKLTIEKSKKKGQNPITYKKGSIDDTDTYKTTKPKNVTKGMLDL